MPDIFKSPKMPCVPISIGELVDKITILQIKKERLKEDSGTKLDFVSVELEKLQPHLAEAQEGLGPEQLDTFKLLVSKLYFINDELWKIEDALRGYEKSGDFSHYFVFLARSVYKMNDKRAEVKLQINELTGSLLREVKVYA